MAKQTNKPAEVSKDTLSPGDKVGATTPKELTPDMKLKEAPTWDTLAKVEVELEVKSKKLEALNVQLNLQREGLKKWEAELLKRAEKLAENGKASKIDPTYLKKLTNCFLNGTVEEYIRTSAEQFEGVTKENFLNTVKDAAEEVLTNP